MTRPNASIALCMIARNEERHLARAIGSVAGAVDEIILVDTGSTDATRELARSLGAVVIEEPWRDDFARARNRSLDAARSDWILVLDADEELDAGARTRLRGTVAAAVADGLQVVMRNLSAPEELCAWRDSRLVRLFQNRPEHRYEQPIHEQIRPSIERHGGRVAATDLLVIHHGYTERAVQGGDSRSRRNLAILDRLLAGDPGDAYLHYQRGVTLKSLGEARAAYASLVEAARRAQLQRPDFNVGDLYMKLAQLALSFHELVPAERHARESLRYEPDNTIARYVLALSLAFRSRFVEARSVFLEIHDEPSLGPSHRKDIEAAIAHCDAQLLGRLRR